MIIKKSTIILSLIGLPLIGVVAQASFITKPYFGLSVGYARHHVDPKSNLGVRYENLAKAKKFDGVPFGIYGGGEVYRNKDIFAALELGFDFISAQKRQGYAVGPYQINYKVKTGASGDLGLKLGVAYAGFVPYVRVSAIATEWTQRASISGPNLSDSSKKAMIKIGVAPGGGFMIKLSPHWTTGVEYKYAMYKKHKVDFQGGKIRIKPRSQDVRLRLSYSFCRDVRDEMN